MKFLLILFGIIIISIIFRFFKDWNKSKSIVTSQGGMQNKYRTLIDLLSYDTPIRIIKLSEDYLYFEVHTPDIINSYKINHDVFNTTINWEGETTLRKYNNKWQFPHGINQFEMAKIIANDMLMIVNTY